MTDILMPWLSSAGERLHFLPKPAPAPDPNNDVSICTVASPSTPNSKPSDRSTSGAFRLLMRSHRRPNILMPDVQASDIAKANLSTVPADIVYEVRSSAISRSRSLYISHRNSANVIDLQVGDAGGDVEPCSYL